MKNYVFDFNGSSFVASVSDDGVTHISCTKESGETTYALSHFLREQRGCSVERFGNTTLIVWGRRDFRRIIQDFENVKRIKTNKWD